MEKISYMEVRRKIRLLTNAADKFGDKLYDETEIAQFFGQPDAAKLNAMMKQFRVAYRKALIERATALEETGLSYLEIAEQMKLDVGTVEILLDKKGNERLENMVKLDEQRMETLGKFFDSFRPSF